MHYNHRITGWHPGKFALFLFTGLVLMAWCVWTLFFPQKYSTDSESQATLYAGLEWAGLCFGFILWALGSIHFGRNFGVRPSLSFLFSLLPPVGLLLTRLIGKRMTPYQVWARQNPLLEGPESRRAYRPMKSLY